MNCAQTRELIDPYVDGELDLTAALDLEHHLDRCPPCARVRARLDTLRAALAAAPFYKAPPALARRIRDALPTSPSLPSSSPSTPHRIVDVFRRPMAVAAALLLVASIAWTAARVWNPAAPDLTRELVAAHVRSLQADHLLDVPSTDQHTVKPWFNGRLDFAPDVRDLAPAGFPLQGGRLDYLNGRPVAALVYRHDRHLINAFVWPAPAATPDAAPTTTTAQGYTLLQFNHHGLTWHAISDASPTTLEQFARAVQSPSDTPPAR
jgi:anti-sigma factor RsiW